jgi:hypothetical protein
VKVHQTPTRRRESNVEGDLWETDFKQYETARFKVLTMMNVKITALWDISLCSLVNCSQHFGGT